MKDSAVHAFAGSLGGAGAMALTYPLEQIRTLQQAGVSVKDRGLTGLYQGCAGVVETVAISNFLYFYCAQYAKELLGTRIKNPVFLSLASSTLAGAANVVLTEPLWKANTILKTSQKESKESLWSVLLNVTKEEGLESLWKGTRVSLWLVSNPVIQFSVYEFLKRMKTEKRNLSAIQAFFLGAVSKMVATLVTYPLQVAQTRLRLPANKDRTMLLVLVGLMSEKGLRGLYQGCTAKLAQTVLTAAFMFAFYERIVTILQHR